MDNNKLVKFLETAIPAAVEAGEAICTVYNQEFDVEFKKDNSPLTVADKEAHKIIENCLAVTELPVLSEEGRDIPYSGRRSWEYFWMVDPLDGTKEFVKKNGEFTVNIALINKDTPVLGVVFAPVLKELFFASEQTGSFKVVNVSQSTVTKKKNFLSSLMETGERLPVNNQRDTFRVVGSKSHMTKETEEYIEELKKVHGNIEIISKGSSLKLCMVAEGLADVYPRFAPTMEWDTAAGHAIAKYAGKKVIHYNTGKQLLYNKENLLNPWFVVGS